MRTSSRARDDVRDFRNTANGSAPRNASSGCTRYDRRAVRSPTPTRAGGKLRVITGVPGAGKAFLIDRIADAYRARRLQRPGGFGRQ
jgi:hypothetical protein